jgi:hypothetical protein
MSGQPRRSPTGAVADGGWDQQVHLDVDVERRRGSAPGLPDADGAAGRVEASAFQRLFQRRDLREQVRVECQVGVGGVLGDADVSVTGVQVDRLRADQNRGVAVLAKGVERIEENPARDHVELIHATPPRA